MAIEKVRAKMVCNSITKSGSERYPNVSINLGAVYSNDPESENRSFATATPSASLTLNIDPGRTAALFFEQGAEYYVDLIPCGIPERRYLKDGLPPVESNMVLSDRDGDNPIPVKWKKDERNNWIMEGLELVGSPYADNDKNVFLLAGLTHWSYAK